jgi:hypothetical protein
MVSVSLVSREWDEDMLGLIVVDSELVRRAFLRISGLYSDFSGRTGGFSSGGVNGDTGERI